MAGLFAVAEAVPRPRADGSFRAMADTPAGLRALPAAPRLRSRLRGGRAAVAHHRRLFDDATLWRDVRLTMGWQRPRLPAEAVFDGLPGVAFGAVSAGLTVFRGDWEIGRGLRRPLQNALLSERCADSLSS